MQNSLNLRDILYLAWKNPQTSERMKFCHFSSLLLDQAAMCYKLDHYTQGRILNSVYSVRKMSVIHLRRSQTLSGSL